MYIDKESETVEFKRSMAELREGAISLCSMLNKHGTGTVYFGIDNNGHIPDDFAIGKYDAFEISKVISDHVIPKVIPSITSESHEDSYVIKVTASGDCAPYSAYGRYYIRSEDNDILMTDRQVLDSLSSASYADGWERMSSGHGAECIDEKALISYMERCNDCGRLDFIYRDPDETLRRLDLIADDGMLNNAGYYLFSRDAPMKVILSVSDSDNMRSAPDVKGFDGNLFECMNETVAFIKSMMNWRTEIHGKDRVEVPELPIGSIHEAVVNGFTHMQYGPGSGIEVTVTPARISISNPGHLPPRTLPEDYADGRMTSALRNPLISEMLYYDGTIGSFGSGFRMIREECSAMRIRYTYENGPGGFRFIFWRSRDPMNTADSDVDKILDIMRKRPDITLDDMVTATGVTKGRIYYMLKDLKAEGKVERIGAKKNGRWTVKDTGRRR